MRELAAQLKEKYPRIDVLANNAGGIMGARELTVDGHEKTFQVNHLAPFLLTTELMDVLTASNATVINTSSAANRSSASWTSTTSTPPRSYSTNRAYGNAQAREHPLHHRAAQPLQRRGHLDGGVPPRRAWPPTSRPTPRARCGSPTRPSSTASC